jgi:hypothetical protein
VTVFWNVNAAMQFLVADAGAVERRFDPLLYHDADGEPLPEEGALPFGDPQAPLHAATLTLAEQLTGVGVPEGWLLREHDAAVIRRSQSSQR